MKNTENINIPDQERIVRTTVPDEAEGVRLDSYLAGRFTYRSRTGWQQSVSDGIILLNGRRTRPSRQLHAGEVISLDVSGIAREEPPVRTDFAVLLETPDFLVVNKPPDLPCHPSGRYFHHTLQRMLEKEFGRVHPVNRLDRETSGVTLFARSGAAAGALAKIFETCTVHKTYLALVEGDFPDRAEAVGFLSADPDSAVHKKRRFTFNYPADAAPGDAVSAETAFSRIGDPVDHVSLVECRPRTGRLHQIRATLLAMGFPMTGDKLYGVDETVFLRFREDAMTADDEKNMRLAHQALHAWKLEFTNPFDGSEMICTAAVPQEFRPWLPQVFSDKP